MRKPHGWVPVITEIHKYKIVLDTILEFIHQIPDDEFTNPEKPNFCVRDFTLEQFQRWLGKKMDDLRINWGYKKEA